MGNYRHQLAYWIYFKIYQYAPEFIRNDYYDSWHPVPPAVTLGKISPKVSTSNFLFIFPYDQPWLYTCIGNHCKSIISIFSTISIKNIEILKYLRMRLSYSHNYSPYINLMEEIGQFPSPVEMDYPFESSYLVNCSYGKTWLSLDCAWRVEYFSHLTYKRSIWVLHMVRLSIDFLSCLRRDNISCFESLNCWLLSEDIFRYS